METKQKHTPELFEGWNVSDITRTVVRNEKGIVIYDGADCDSKLSYQEVKEITQLIASAPETSAERDRLKEENEALKEAYKDISERLTDAHIEIQEMKIQIKGMTDER